MENFPSALTGNVVFRIRWQRNYTVKLDNLVLHLSGITGKGDNRKARYNLQSAD